MFAINLFKMLHLLVMFGLKMFVPELQVLTILIFLQLFFAVSLY